MQASLAYVLRNSLLLYTLGKKHIKQTHNGKVMSVHLHVSSLKLLKWFQWNLAIGRSNFHSQQTNTMPILHKGEIEFYQFSHKQVTVVTGRWSNIENSLRAISPGTGTSSINWTQLRRFSPEDDNRIQSPKRCLKWKTGWVSKTQ
jgi:hypothetical protein